MRDRGEWERKREKDNREKGKETGERRIRKEMEREERGEGKVQQQMVERDQRMTIIH